MTVEELICYGKKYISKTYVEMLLASLLSVNALELLLILDQKVDEENIKKFQKMVEAIRNNKPIQYVIGNVNFYGNTFIVNENVLIPRFETEELVENTINYIKKYFSDNSKVIDLGCGSGAIGLTLKKKISNLDVTLLDISKEALEVAKLNANNLNCEVKFIESDMWNNVLDKYDVVISNPPYIRTNEEIEDIVKNNEPHLALYGGEDGLDLYRKIRNDILNHVNKEFLIAFEIGDLQKEEVTKIFNDIEGVNIYCKKDLQGRDRMLFISNKIDF